MNVEVNKTNENAQLLEAVFMTGGVTYSPDVPTPTEGYMVGVKNMFIRQGITLSQTELDSLKLELQASNGLFIGGWFDKSDSRCHWDISNHYTDLDNALSIARALKEIAIWDIANACEITL